MHNRILRTAALTILAGTAALAAACDSSEEMAAEDHTPVRFDMAVNGVTMPDDTLRLRAGVVDSVRFTFFNAADDDLGDIEIDHYSAVTFPGAVVATAATDSVAHYTQVVTNAETAGITGTSSVGFGHDAAADEYSFPTPFKFE